MKIADKWAIIDIDVTQLSDETYSFIRNNFKSDYVDGNLIEDIYQYKDCYDRFVNMKNNKYKKEVEEQINKLMKLCEENDAFYFRIIII